MNDIEQRVRSVYPVLDSNFSVDDFEEKERRSVLRRFVSVRVHYQFAYPALRKLDDIAKRLEPLSREHILRKFLQNGDNAKLLSDLVDDLAAAITYYQVRAPGPTTIFNEYPARFHYHDEYKRAREYHYVRGKFLPKFADVGEGGCPAETSKCIASVP